ncbi:uncharacterized protein LOC112576143 [Pomacea canaliculata]|uniref:uncharacterized protein LOC112576143 n=1 Tax=Pomacea canaliculata TaxID=400727 RepID=UPI000D72D632|nr:uncharacterized protein LOC112576143 [Pomacea canaliculata]
MEANPIFPPRIMFGQGKRTMTLLTEDGCVYPIIAHDAKNDRPASHRRYSAPVRRGDRPMHRTTLLIAKAPWQPDYTTTTREFYGGSKHLEPALQLPPSPSMHHTHFRLGGYGGQEVADPSFKKTDYAQTYIPKDIISANRFT